tara:strand:+ start:221 stop:409 length:189 start_codon:yes stop_codon:yes gene_type:complete
MIFNRLMKKRIEGKMGPGGQQRGGMLQGLLGKKKKRGVLQNLARMNMMKGLGAMSKGLLRRR